MTRLLPGGAVETPRQAQVLYARPAAEGGLEPCHGAPEMVWTMAWEETLRRAFWQLTKVFVYRVDPPGRDTWGVCAVTARWLRGRWQRLLHGDCDDFAVELLRRLLKAGFPRGALRLTVCRLGGGRPSRQDRSRDPSAGFVRTAFARGHMVLTIETERGTLVADSRARLCWLGAPALTGYRFIARERPDGAPGRQWERLTPLGLEEILRRNQQA